MIFKWQRSSWALYIWLLRCIHCFLHVSYDIIDTLKHRHFSRPVRRDYAAPAATREPSGQMENESFQVGSSEISVPLNDVRDPDRLQLCF